jgi:hypothetical protein
VELVEAARTGQIALAAGAVERLARTTRLSGTQRGLGIEARSRALVSDSGGAEPLYLEAIERLGRCRGAAALARAHLVFGEWLRRENRRVDARVQLRTAHQMFAAMGAEAFAERARRELVATGETVRKRTVETRVELTAQERQIARRGPGRIHEFPDRRRAFPQRAHGRVAPAQGVRQARHQLSPRAPHGTARPRRTGPARLTRARRT